MSTIFQKIIGREIPADIIHDDEVCISIMDIEPQAPFHALIIPKKLIARVSLADETDQQILGHLLLTARNSQANLEQGFRIIINNGKDGGETVPHLHVHLLGGRKLSGLQVNPSLPIYAKNIPFIYGDALTSLG